jgi:anti-sigma regulatory factor (Ser/Thr protein kinase)
VRRFGLSAVRETTRAVGPRPATALTLHELLPASLESVAAARRAIHEFARDLEVDLDGVVLAVSEAVANVVAHAYAEQPDGVVELSAAASPLELTVTVRDHGAGLAGAGVSDGAGYGLLIIRRLAQHVELADTRDGVALTMAFRRGGAWSAS